MKGSVDVLHWAVRNGTNIVSMARYIARLENENAKLRRRLECTAVHMRAVEDALRIPNVEAHQHAVLAQVLREAREGSSIWMQEGS